jgi:bifunctional DNA-binding transcriptional regulator/antitoxin component of YhaV-PrlF toxin-antitoxin module
MNFCTGNLYIYEDEEAYIIVEGVEPVDEINFVAILLGTDLEDYKDFIGKKVMMNIMTFELVVSYKQLNFE